MKVRRSLSLKTANDIANDVLSIGRQNEMSPLAVVVLDSGGAPIAFQSEDGCGVLRFEVAMGKAFGCLGMGTSSRDLRDRMEQRPNFANALAAASKGKFVPAPGGVVIVDTEGQAIGSVGVSGDTSERDEFCAVVAIQNAGFASEPADANLE